MKTSRIVWTASACVMVAAGIAAASSGSNSSSSGQQNNCGAGIEMRWTVRNGGARPTCQAGLNIANAVAKGWSALDQNRTATYSLTDSMIAGNPAHTWTCELAAQNTISCSTSSGSLSQGTYAWSATMPQSSVSDGQQYAYNDSSGLPATARTGAPSRIYLGPSG
jgi:hypothetical protein